MANTNEMEISLSLNYKYNKSQKMKLTSDMNIQYMRWKDGSEVKRTGCFFQRS